MDGISYKEYFKKEYFSSFPLRIKMLQMSKTTDAVTSKGKPSYSVLGIAIFWLEFKKSETCIKEQVKFLYPNFKKSGKEKVSKLVNQYQYA